MTEPITASTTNEPAQCDLNTDIIETMCTEMRMVNVTVGRAAVLMEGEVSKFLNHLFEYCQSRTFTVKLDFSIDFHP